MLANLVILFADSPNRTWLLCAVSLTLVIISAVVVTRTYRKRPPPYQPQLVRANGNTWINPNFPRPKPVENEETRREEIKSLRRHLDTRDKTIDSLRWRIHHAEAEREREHQSALRQLSHRVQEADSSIEMRQVYWTEWQKERLRSCELEIALGNLQRGNTHRQLTRERDAAQRDAQRAEISEKEAQRKLAKVLAKAESLKEDAEMARKEAREVKLAKAIVEEKNASLEHELKQTKKAYLDDAEKIKELGSRLQRSEQEKQEQLRRVNAAEKRAEAAEKTHDDFAAKNITPRQDIKALEVKKNELEASGLQELRTERDRLETRNGELQAAVQGTSESNEQLKMEIEVANGKYLELERMLEAASKRIEELTATQKGLMKRIELLDAEKAHLMHQVQHPQNNSGDNEIIRRQNGLLSKTIEEMKRQYHTDMDDVKARAQGLAGQVTDLQATNEQLVENLTQRDQELKDEKKKLKIQQDRLAETQNMRRHLISKEQAATKAAEQTQKALDECQKKLERRTKTANHLAELNAQLKKEKDDLKAELEEVYGDEKYDESQDQDGIQPQYTNNPEFAQNDYQSSQYDAFGCDREDQYAYPPPPQDHPQTTSSYPLPGLGQPSASANIPGQSPLPGFGDLSAIAEWNASHPRQPSNGTTSRPTGQAPTGGDTGLEFPNVDELVNASDEEVSEVYGGPEFNWDNVDPSLLQ